MRSPMGTNIILILLAALFASCSSTNERSLSSLDHLQTSLELGACKIPDKELSGIGEISRYINAIKLANKEVPLGTVSHQVAIDSYNLTQLLREVVVVLENKNSIDCLYLNSLFKDLFISYNFLDGYFYGKTGKNIFLNTVPTHALVNRKEFITYLEDVIKELDK